MSFPFYRQPDSMDCGPTCLQIVAKYHGRSLSLQALRESSQIGKHGVNLLGISEAAESIGFRTQAVSLSYQTLASEAPLPAILHWDRYHFVVLYKIKKNLIFISDPAHGLVTINKSEFLRHWLSDGDRGQAEEGIALILETGPKFFEDETFKNSGHIEDLALRNIFGYLMPFKRLLFQLFVGVAVASLLQLVLPFLAQSVVDVGINTSNINFVYLVLSAQFALVVGRLIADVIRNSILLHISTRISISILTDFLIKLMKLPVSFFDSKRTGDILQRMNDHERIESFLTGSSISMLFSTLSVIVLSIVLAVYNLYIFSVFVVFIAFYSAWIIVFLKRRKLLDYRRFDIAAKEQSAAIQIVQGMQEIKLNGIEKQMRWGWESLQASLFRLYIFRFKLAQWQQAGATFINEAKNLLMALLSAKAVIEGKMTLGSMLAVQYIIGQLNSPIDQMLGFIQNWQNAKLSMRRLNEIHSMEDEEPVQRQLIKELPLGLTRRVNGGGWPIKSERERNLAIESQRETQFHEYSISKASQSSRPPDKASIVFSDVSFTYPGAGNEPILQNISLIIPVGTKTAIVGMSGSGKTTLLKLLLKFYEPQKGSIRINSTSLATISHREWRSHCGVVMQESFIFSDTIARNIAIGADRIDLDKLKYSISIANLEDVVEGLPLGINTKIGAEGTGISMGQKQRILIARAIYRNPEFILFDEATNSLDANNESVILDNLGSAFVGKTVIVVAHRLSTVKGADQIILLHRGRIVERGTHGELVKIKGEYYKLVQNQLDLGN